MKKFLLNLPIPVAAVGLSFAGFANLFALNPSISWVFAIFSLLILIAVVVKFILNPTMFKQQLNQAPIAATFPTFFMGLAFLAKFLLPISRTLSLILWFIATIGHALFIVYFSLAFAMKKDLSLVLPSWFIVYIGIVASAISGPMFQSNLITTLSKGLFLFGVLSFIILLPIVFMRLKKHNLPTPVRGTFAILAAPASLNLVGYLATHEQKTLWLVLLQVCLMLLLYVIVLIKLPKLLSERFTPAQAGMTFPLVITATAVKQSGVFLSKQLPAIQPVFTILSWVTLIIALIVVFLITIRFIKATYKMNQTA
ncbi:TDT family transporter [Vagococcus sp.]|uniref:TDT family transporter n=1 Tax=Vagococcus sp. TaxID=1933889 RepID=UPI002FC9DB45